MTNVPQENNKRKLPPPSNVGAERAVIAGLCRYGQSVFVDCNEIVNADCFTNALNQMAFHVAKECLQESTSIDSISFMAKALSLGYSEIQNDRNTVDYINFLFSNGIKEENVVKNATIIRKLEIARKLQSLSVEAYKELAEVTGEEPLDTIVSKVENAMFNYTASINNGVEDKTELIGNGIEDYIQHLEDNPVTNIGIPSPWPIYNRAIGGGRRRGEVYLIGARPKCLSPYTRVWTPTGIKQLKKLKFGDEILHPSGKTQKVVKVIPKFESKMYHIIFSDGSRSICTAEHEWKVKSINGKVFHLKTTLDLIGNLNVGPQEKGTYKWVIQPTKIKFRRQYFQDGMSPYLYGVLLNKGIKRKNDNPLIYNVSSDILDEIGKKNKFELHRIDKKRKLIYKVETKYSGKKNVYDFIYNTEEIRKHFLSGLLDSRSIIKTKKRGSIITYWTKDSDFADAIIQLVYSLGGLASIYRVASKPKYFFVDIKLDYNPFLANSKKVRFKPFKSLDRRIVEIKLSDFHKEAMCITVSSKDGMFVVDNAISTHNCGKSSLAINDAIHVAKELKVPVLYLDTEMSKEGQWPRILANLSSVDTNLIETGNFGKNSFQKTSVHEAGKTLSSMPLSYRKVAGKPFPEILSIIRRWIIQVVGTTDGVTNNCLIIYDYFKLMDTSQLDKLAEYQAVGFQIQDLANFCKKYDVSCQSFVQLNRDGITKDTTDTISQSDRLLWLCASLAMLKRKTPEEISVDGPENGNMKLIVGGEQRYGPGLDDTDWINLSFQKDRCQIRELDLRSKQTKSEAFETETADDDDDTDEEEAPFQSN